MAGDIEVRGLDDLARLSHAMRGMGETQLRRELRSGLTQATKPVRAQMRQGIVPALPKSGGLAVDVLKSTRFTTTASTANTSKLGVRIRATGRRSIRRMNATGTFRHPVWGRTTVWVTQRVGDLRGFLDRPFEASRPQVQAAVWAAIARVRDKINRSM